MSIDKKLTRERWTQLESSRENAWLQCAGIRTSVLSYTRTFGNKAQTRSCVKRKQLDEAHYFITVWRKKEKKKRCVRTIVSKSQIFKLHSTRAIILCPSDF